ncbi:response regulator [Sulfurimonas sp.]|uniref:response regulator transcription factor n=1 Tax=Sulfurimonas sp. TaxID=2022749 RepID=UPI0025ECDF26|nr:response regulator [Sulfurimonas sp.]MBW6488814.1 response regulator [Sulfurimonas sp.]
MKIEKIRDISILLAEDEIELREMLCEYLNLFFNRVYSASTGSEAYDIYKQKRPNIILTDISMPNLDGLDMIAKIRKCDKDTKIIIMSAHSEQEKLLHAIKLRLETYLIKPIKTELLKSVLLDAVELIRKTTNRTYVSDTTYWENEMNTLWENGREIKLRKMERVLLKLLFSKPNQCFGAKDIFEHLHDSKEQKEFSIHAITSLMKRLRAKLPNGIVHNVYGSGYKIVPI